MCGIVGYIGREQRAMDVLIDGLRRLQSDHHFFIIFGRTKTVDARYAGDDDYVAAADQ